jgi:hypothetical protein
MDMCAMCWLEEICNVKYDACVMYVSFEWCIWCMCTDTYYMSIVLCKLDVEMIKQADGFAKV